MGRTVKDRRGYEPRPVDKIELSEKNKRLRLIAVIVFLLIGAGFLTYGFVNYLAPDNGWNTIESNSPGSAELVFQYDFGSGGIFRSAEKKAVTALYSDAVTQCCRLFHDSESFPNVVNVYEINRSANVVLELEKTLYDAFSRFSESGSRLLYLQPIYSRYRNVFYCGDDSQLADFDPFISAEIRGEFEKTAAFAADKNSVELRLLGDNKVMLFVSEEYLKYAEEEGITDFIGFSVFANAFVVDHIAEVMIENGYTRCNISSYDGYTRNLDDSGEQYAFNIFDREGGVVYPAAMMRYSGRRSIVFMRNYPMNSLDSLRYYELRDGEIRAPYIAADGLPRTAADNLVCYSDEKTCAEIALAALPIYAAEILDKNGLDGLITEKIYSIYCEDFSIVRNDDSLVLTDLYDKDGVSY